jgi:hypothetical protein
MLRKTLRRPLTVVYATAAMFLVVAASASANSIDLTAKPLEPTRAGDYEHQQLLTVKTVVDSMYGNSVRILGYEVGSPCPAAPGAGNPTYESENAFAPAQGSSTTQFKDPVPDVSHTHLCGYLTTNQTPYSPGSSIVTDAPLKTWSDVAGWNAEAVLFWLGGGGHEYFAFDPWCSAGKTGSADADCAYSGRARVTVSSKLREKLHLKSRTILDHRFSGVERVPGGGRRIKWAPPKGFNARAERLAHLPVKMTVTWKTPIAKTATGYGDIRGKCNGQVWAATYERRICGQDGAGEGEG